ncbi:MAG TPA: hypothetical protein VII94_03490 [Candidatus Saccharimonadales bacterium]
MFLGKHFTNEEERQLSQWVQDHYSPLEIHIHTHMCEAVGEMIETFSIIDEE